MGILSGLFKSRDKPQNRTAGSAYSFFRGSSAAGKQINERSAMQMTAVYSCVRILSEAVASLPVHVYKYNDSGGKEKALDRPLYFLLYDEPNLEMASFVFRETLMTDRMKVDRDEHGQLYYEYNLSSEDAQNEMVRLEELNRAKEEVAKAAGKKKPVTQRSF